MTTTRLEAFSDGVIAILITVMVLEFKMPHGAELRALADMGPIFSCYILSFVFVGIYWNNHHHLLHSVKHIDGAVLWANLHLLFWLSLIPFATGWMADTHFTSGPVLLYGAILLMLGTAYTVLTVTLVRVNGPHSEVAKRLGRDTKGKISLAIYAAAIAVAMFLPLLSCALYATVALIWLVPDRRFEHTAGRPADD